MPTPVALRSLRLYELVTIATRRGPVEAVLAGTRSLRSGWTEYLFGPLAPGLGRKGGDVYFQITERQARCVTPCHKQVPEPARKAAAERAFAVKQARQEQDWQRTAARREAQGTPQWDARGRLSGTERFKVGDTITIRGPYHPWDARIVALNVASGKLGIARDVPSAARDRALERQGFELLALGKVRTKGPRPTRWIDPRHVIAVNGTPLTP